MRKELYIIFWGRVVTNMGALIWPMLTLILKNKLGFSAGEAANLMLIIGIIQLPCTLIGGKLADRFNKKNIIVICDLITVVGYTLCGILPLNNLSIVIFAIAGIFAQFEWPSYDALVASLSTQEERERAYSLNYLGANLGLVLAPTLGGLLFANHLNLAFLISGLATFSSTVLIFFFIKDTSESQENSAAGKYEEVKKDSSTKDIFVAAPVLMLFVLCTGIGMSIYTAGFNFLMPLNMENLFGEHGALLFGTLTSVNALVVIIGTPICTSLLSRIRDTEKLQIGLTLQISGYVCFFLGGGKVFIYYLAMVIFTVGEILQTLGQQPYITRRIPSSHRGRISSVNTVVGMLFQGICLYSVGHLADHIGVNSVWILLITAGVVNILLLFLLRNLDKKQFHLLYQSNESSK